MQEYRIIGVMSGTSLDGVDIAYCTFKRNSEKWFFEIQEAITVEYDKIWKERLSTVEKSIALDLIKTNNDYGYYLGELINRFIQETSIKPDLISSHGHTIFHQPEKKITYQIGSGAAIAAITNLPVICDFRTLDVALGGQGAPLVPIGDEQLFSDYNYCLNLGGIANVSYNNGKHTTAFDICPVNIVLNYLAGLLGYDYDRDGLFSAAGFINQSLLNELSQLIYYKTPAPKSLGKEWVMETFIPIIDKHPLSIEDKLATVSEHIAMKIMDSLPDKKADLNMLITGGGAFNQHLIERIKKKCPFNIIIPDSKTINYKEALIFAFLGVLRVRNEVNCLKSVTGALKNNIGGTIYQG